MNYSGRVMELSVDWGAAELRNQAAEIAAEADAEIEELRLLLGDCRQVILH